MTQLSQKYRRTVKNHMESSNYYLKRNKNHMVWCHNDTNKKICVSNSPKNPSDVLKFLKMNISDNLVLGRERSKRERKFDWIRSLGS
jgi:hypothetical protein